MNKRPDPEQVFNIASPQDAIDIAHDLDSPPAGIWDLGYGAGQIEVLRVHTASVPELQGFLEEHSGSVCVVMDTADALQSTILVSRMPTVRVGSIESLYELGNQFVDAGRATRLLFHLSD